MSGSVPWHSGMAALPLLTDARTRSVSAENPTGAKGAGGMAVPNPDDPNLPYSRHALALGQGWKVNPFVKPRARQTLTLMDVDGPGVIQHIWMTTEREWQGNGRACVLRFYWDGEETPSVEVPLTDFFAVGHDVFAPVNSMAVVVNPQSALNCYWPMPFRKHARITFTNELDRDLSILAYQITYAETPVSQEAGYFHAQWRRAVSDPKWPEHVILEGVRGKGRYVGTFLAWTQLVPPEVWFGEGEVKFFMDGDTKFPTICGTGTEDYFCGSWGFPNTYSTAYVGNTLKQVNPAGITKWAMYRWHIPDPICFQEDLRVIIQTLGMPRLKPYLPLADDVASVGYWYQSEPHAEFPKLLPVGDRWPR